MYKLVYNCLDSNNYWYACDCGNIHDVAMEHGIKIISNRDFAKYKEYYYFYIKCEKYSTILTALNYEKRKRYFPYINWLQKSGYEYEKCILNTHINYDEYFKRILINNYEYSIESGDRIYILSRKFNEYNCVYRLNLRTAFNDKYFITNINEANFYNKELWIELAQKIIDIGGNDIMNFYKYCITDVENVAIKYSYVLDFDEYCKYYTISKDIYGKTNFGIFLRKLFNVDCYITYYKMDFYVDTCMATIHIGDYYKISIEKYKYIYIGFHENILTSLITLKFIYDGFYTHIDVDDSACDV